MNASRTTVSPPVGAREKLLDAALRLIRQRGYGATSIDALCAEVGVTKGAFFHHFKSKETLGVAAAVHWSQTTDKLFAGASYHDLADPLDRVLAYIDFRTELLDGPLEEITCLVGTMVQESYQSSDAIRAACDASISSHAATLEADIAEAAEKYGIVDKVQPASLALHTQAVLQGAFILAKAKGDASIARDSTAHLKRYFEMLFSKKQKRNRQPGEK